MWNANHEKILQALSGIIELGNFFLLALLFSDFKQRGALVTHVHTHDGIYSGATFKEE